MESSLFSLMYNGPLFILGIFWLFFRKQEGIAEVVMKVGLMLRRQPGAV